MVPLSDCATWKPAALEVAKQFVTDGTWIEDKEFALVWHYEDADPEYGQMQASELEKYMSQVLNSPTVDIVKYDYNRIVEVKPKGVSKGLAATAIIKFVLPRPSSSFGGIDFSTPSSPRQSRVGGNTAASPPRSPRASTTTSPTHMAASYEQIFSHPSALANVAAVAAATSDDPPFLLAVGDDRGDEDMFAVIQSYKVAPVAPPNTLDEVPLSTQSLTAATASALRKTMLTRLSSSPPNFLPISTVRPPSTFTVCVGMKPSCAHYYVHDDEEVIKMLEVLAVCAARLVETRHSRPDASTAPTCAPTSIPTRPPPHHDHHHQHLLHQQPLQQSHQLQQLRPRSTFDSRNLASLAE